VCVCVCGVGTGTSCRHLFKDCKIPTFTSLYAFEVLCFLKKYKSAVQKINRYMIIIQGQIEQCNKVPINIKKSGGT
jgi:hypothetical protein